MKNKKKSILHSKFQESGFTLVELVIIIVVLGTIAVISIPKVGSMIKSARINKTKTELTELKKAIVGTPQMIAGGTFVNRGFLGDVGFVPSQLTDLVYKPDSVQAWNRIMNLGWNGPYMDSTDGEYLVDAWDVNYVYNPSAQTIISTGSGSNITISF